MSQSYEKGDLLVHVNIWTPKSPNEEERKLLERMRELGNFEPKPSKGERGFFEKMRDYFR